MLRLTLVTPLKKLTTELPVEELFVPGFRGELEIMAGHAPLVTTLNTGVLRYRAKSSTEMKFVAISWGYCEIFGDHVSVLAETAEFPEEIEADRSAAARKLAEEKLTSFNSGDYNFEKFANKYTRANVRLEVAKEKKEN